MVWIEFFVCALSLTFFAYRLCKEGVIIAEKTHLTEGLIGMFFLAVATSFPEIVTSSSAVFSLGRIGMGYGDIVGSIIVNSMILFGLDYFYNRGRVLAGVSALTKLTVFFVLIVAIIVLIAAGIRTLGMKLPSFGRVGLESLIIVIVYFVYLRIIRREGDPGHKGVRKTDGSFWKIWLKFAILLIVVMFLGVWMARIGDKIVKFTTLSQTFIGTLMLGTATSLPEIIVSFAAIKAASVDMAVGNILGSNLFDICIIPFLDFLCESPILGVLTKGQMMATVLVFILSGIVVLGILSKKDKPGRFSWDTGVIFSMGLVGFVFLYFIR